MKRPAHVPPSSACPCGSGRALAECCRTPPFAAAFGQAIAHHQQGQLDAAEPLYEFLLGQQPDNPDLLHYRGLLAYQRGQIPAALTWLEQAVTRRPQLAAYRVNYAHALKAGELLEPALEQYASAVALDPGLPAAAYGQARLLRTLGRESEAMSALGDLLARFPGFAAAWGELASLRYDAERIDDADAAYQQQLLADPGAARAYCARGAIALRFGEHASARAFYARAEALSVADSPDRLVAQTGRLFGLAYTEPDGAKILAAHQTWAASRPQLAAPPLLRQRGDQLRLGFLSGDLRAHAMRFFARALIKDGADKQLSISVFSTRENAPGDPFGAEFRQAARSWHDISRQTDEQAAVAIKQQGVDVLIDLCGLSAGNRLGLLERRPAPRQGNMLGYMTSTGMPALDFRLSDRRAVPESRAGWFSEDLVYLPDSQWCYVPDPSTPEVSPLPAARHRHLTLGAFHNAAKLGAPVLDLYVKALQTLPTARLQLVIWGERPQVRLRDFFAAAGVGGRVDFLPPRPYADYLKYYSQIDIALDSFPYAGGTVSCESLWMGVPVLSLAHDSPAGRGGASILGAAGMPEWVADSPQAWLDILARQAADPLALAERRATLRAELARSPLMDVDSYRRGFAAAICQYLDRPPGASS